MSRRTGRLLTLAALCAMLLLAGCVSEYGAYQGEVERAGANAQLTLEAAQALQAVHDVKQTQAVATAGAVVTKTALQQTAWANATQGAVNHATWEAAMARATFEAAGTAHAAVMTATAEAAEAEARAIARVAQANATATAQAIFAEQMAMTQQYAVAAATATAQWEAKQSAWEEDWRRFQITTLPVVAFAFAFVIAIVVISLAIVGYLRWLRRPRLERVKMDERVLAFSHDDDGMTTVVDPSLGVLPAMRGDQLGPAAGVSLEEQLQAVTFREAVRLAYAMWVEQQRQPQGASRRKSAPFSVEEWTGLLQAGQKPPETQVRVVVLPVASPEALVTQGSVPPMLAEAIEGDWAEIVEED
jgi:hypothetical protein